MNFEQYQYTIAGLKAIQSYPQTKMVKRYFRGFRQNAPDKLYRIIAYPYEMVKSEQLITNLKALKNIEHPLLCKISHLYQETTLTKIGQKPQQVIAILFQEDLQGSYLNLYDFIMQINVMNQKLAKDVIYQLVNFIKFMEEKNFIDCFNSNDIFIDKTNGNIKVDCYGDYRHFVIKDQDNSSIWQLGTLIFILLKGHPPYSKKTASDPLYKCLNKGEFQKFWQKITTKPVSNPSQNAIKFLNLCFQKQTTFQTLRQNPWLATYQPLTIQQKIQEIAVIQSAKNQNRINKQQKNRERKEKMIQAARQRVCTNRIRGTYPQQIQQFLDYLYTQQQQGRPLKFHTYHPETELKQQTAQKIKIQIAQLLTFLHRNQDKSVRIYQIRDRKDYIQFKLKTEVGGAILIDCEVKLGIQIMNDQARFVAKKIQGNLYESLWINNYLRQLCMQI